MKQNRILRHAIGVIIAAGATPSLAQEVRPVAPPTLAPVTAPPVAAPEATPPAATAPARVFGPASPVVQAVPPRAPVIEEPASEPASQVSPARRAARAVAPPATVRAQPVRSAPAAAAAATPEPVASPVSVTPAPASDITPVRAAESAPPTADEVAPTQPLADSAMPWALIGLATVAILGLIAFLLFRRRRSQAVYSEQSQDEPVVFADQPVAAAAVPLAPAAVAANSAARPWIELGMRPVRAGMSADDATLEIELTIDNSSDVPAHNIRVSTWMMAASANLSDNERTLIDPPADTQVAECDLAPGEARQIGAILTVPKSELGGGAEGQVFRPLIVADARYPLPDGGEGRISASFEVGAATGDRPDPIDIDAAPADLDAQLHGALERT